MDWQLLDEEAVSHMECQLSNAQSRKTAAALTPLAPHVDALQVAHGHAAKQSVVGQQSARASIKISPWFTNDADGVCDVPGSSRDVDAAVGETLGCVSSDGRVGM